MIYDAQKSQGPLQGWLSSHSLSLLVTMELRAELGREKERMGQWGSEASCQMHGLLLASECFESESHQAGYPLTANRQGNVPCG